MRSKYTKELLEPLVQKNISIAGVMRDLGLQPSGGNHSHISKTIKKFGLDISHFTGKTPGKGKSPGNKLKWQTILTNNRVQHRLNSTLLTRGLLESGRKYICELCKITDIWNNKKLVLHIHHINGDWLDNTAENLQFLCPNCHSQTENWCGKNIDIENSLSTSYKNKRRQNRKPNSYCKICNKSIYNKRNKFCSVKCRAKNQEKINWPSKEQLKKLLELYNFCEIGKQLKVSDNAVKKRAKKYNLI